MFASPLSCGTAEPSHLRKPLAHTCAEMPAFLGKDRVWDMGPLCHLWQAVVLGVSVEWSLGVCVCLWRPVSKHAACGPLSGVRFLVFSTFSEE